MAPNGYSYQIEIFGKNRKVLTNRWPLQHMRHWMIDKLIVFQGNKFELNEGEVFVFFLEASHWSIVKL